MSNSSRHIDISIFWDLPQVMRFRVFREGKPLYTKDELSLQRLKADTLKAYLDIQPSLQEDKYITLTNVTAIAKVSVEANGLSVVKLAYTGDHGWQGDVSQVRYDVMKLSRLGGKARHSSDEAVRQAVNDLLSSVPDDYQK